MNWDQIQGNWQEVKGKLRDKWGKLTDQDVESVGGKKDQLVGALRQRYGMEAEKAHNEIDTWISSLTDKIAGRGKSEQAPIEPKR